MVSEREQRRAAYHEAGHAVVRYARTGRSGDVEILPDGSGRAHRPIADELLPSVLDQAHAETQILIALAGPLAEARGCRVALER